MSRPVLLVAGARPNFMKVAPILRALERANVESILVHTGQHYDDRMSAAFFRELAIREPDFHLGVGSGTHAQQTARIMEAFEPVITETKPEWVVVVGDVNSTLACALVVSKLKRQLAVRVAHVEAGLRSGNWDMPEEVNRVLTDRLSDLLLTPSRDVLPNLLAEGLLQDRVRFVGNVMIDTLYEHLPEARAAAVPERLGVTRGNYTVVTLHRPSNVDDPVALGTILEGLRRIRTSSSIVFPMHPRTRAAAIKAGFEPLLESLQVLEPLGYIDMLSLSEGAAVVVTDSGGMQEETTVLGVPCVTLREETERPVTVTEGTNRLAPWPLTVDGIVQSFDDARARGRVAVGARCPEGWDGRAAQRIVEALTMAPLDD